jgi:hypothetical protein
MSLSGLSAPGCYFLLSVYLCVCSSQVPAQVPARFQPGSSQVPARFQPGSSQVPARFQSRFQSRFKFAFHNLYCILAVLIEFVCLHCLCELISLIRGRTIFVVVIFESATSIIVLFHTRKYGRKDTLPGT